MYTSALLYACAAAAGARPLQGGRQGSSSEVVSHVASQVYGSLLLRLCMRGDHDVAAEHVLNGVQSGVACAAPLVSVVNAGMGGGRLDLPRVGSTYTRAKDSEPVAIVDHQAIASCPEVDVITGLASED